MSRGVATVTQAEFWLLDAAVEMAIDLPVLVNPEIELALNRKDHGLEAATLVEVMVGLFKKGLISGTRNDEPLELRAEAVEQGLAELSRNVRGKTYYKLTAAGGAAWEMLSLPDWTKYCDGREDASQRAVEAGRLELARTCFAEFSDRAAPVAGTVTEVQLSAWQATYWKQVSEGFRVSGSIVAVRRTAPPHKSPWSGRWYSQPTFGLG